MTTPSPTAATAAASALLDEIKVGDDNLEDLRQKGNHEFQQGELDNAVMYYTLAIERATTEMTASATNIADGVMRLSEELKTAIIINLCNRAACAYQMERYEMSRDDALRAWNLSNHQHAKAAYRLAKTYIALELYSSAQATLDDALDTIATLDEVQTKAFEDLLQEAKSSGADGGGSNNITTVKNVQRPVSIREFIKQKSLGVGNFSEIVVAQHRKTEETFALKILPKKQAADLAKRQHPNVYNEIKMEARVLLQRLPPHPFLVRMYHSFQDYENLYYLMDLHSTNPDLWSRIRYNGCMVGCHGSQVKVWMRQLIDVLEHLHCHGIVHRDLKPENVLLNERNHVVLIDFGTAKDLVHTDLNGPEFVGTPDFMSPEAVTGFSAMPGKQKSTTSTFPPATHTADLWALGAMAYILMTGCTPYWSPSPYLTFLRIKRGLLPRMSWGIPDADAWDLVTRLMQVQPDQRFGADCFQVQNGKVVASGRNDGGKPYDKLRNHAFFSSSTNNNGEAQNDDANAKDAGTDDDDDAYKTEHNIPSLQDLCIRACAELAKQDALNLEVCDQYPPGCKSKRHDFLLLADRERKLILHTLDRCKVFAKNDETRVLHRFVASDPDLLDIKMRDRDMVGLTQMNDDEGKLQAARGSADPYATKDDPEPTHIVHLLNEALYTAAGSEDEQEEQKKRLKEWKKCIANINRSRPKLVVVTCRSAMPAKFKKFLSRVSDSIPVAYNRNASYYSFWLNGFQGMVLNSATLLDEFVRDKGNGGKQDDGQMAWIQEQMEQCRMSKHHLYAFVDCDPRDLSQLVLKRLARGRVKLLSGYSRDNEGFEMMLEYKANEKVVVGGSNDDNDAVSVKSTDTQEDDETDASQMKVVGCNDSSLRWIVMDEMKDMWKTNLVKVGELE